jgi:hypothetical protein
VVVAPRFFVYPGYKSVEDEPKIRQLIYKGLKEIETEIRKRMLNSDNVEELGRALKAINMIAVRVKSTEGRPTSKKDLEQIDAPFQFSAGRGGLSGPAHRSRGRGAGRVGASGPLLLCAHRRLARALRPWLKRQAAERGLPLGPAGARLHEGRRVFVYDDLSIDVPACFCRRPDVRHIGSYLELYRLSLRRVGSKYLAGLFTQEGSRDDAWELSTRRWP